MSGEGENVKAELRSGDFGGCLVGGSPEERARGRKIKRRAIVISVVVQTAAMAALLIVPLLAKPAPLAVPNYVPIPPYSHSASRSATQDHRHHTTVTTRPIFADPMPTSTTIGHVMDRISDGPVDPPDIPGTIDGSGPSAGLRIADTRSQPTRPAEPRQKTRIHEANINPALLIHRIEPVFPPLARQIRRSGKVELHAIISTDGSIQSLEVVSGDPLFVQSAIDAVRHWRYKPTLLNGQPVEVDTFITVLYTLNQQQ
ncbi:MAG TPA: energy transducer TonB [Candidatus Acidoferrum sp.]|nr:energy transducer TonB [Candidatus Acidoferrum sp.]